MVWVAQLRVAALHDVQRTETWLHAALELRPFTCRALRYNSSIELTAHNATTVRCRVNASVAVCGDDVESGDSSALAERLASKWLGDLGSCWLLRLANCIRAAMPPARTLHAVRSVVVLTADLASASAMYLPLVATVWRSRGFMVMAAPSIPQKSETILQPICDWSSIPKQMVSAPMWTGPRAGCHGGDATSRFRWGLTAATRPAGDNTSSTRRAPLS